MEKYTIHFQGFKVDGSKSPAELIEIFASGYNHKVEKCDSLARKMLEQDEELWEVRWEDINFGQGHYISDFTRISFAKGGDTV